jgi:hypothetical protein
MEKKHEKAAVRLEQIDGMWTVFVVEDGETLQRTFEKQEWAESYAEGQLTRLRLARRGAPKGSPSARAATR